MMENIHGLHSGVGSKLKGGGPRFIKNRYPRPPSGSHAYSLQTSFIFTFYIGKVNETLAVIKGKLKLVIL